MKRWLCHMAAGLTAACVWIVIAILLGVPDYDRGWWAGAISMFFICAALWRRREPA